MTEIPKKITTIEARQDEVAKTTTSLKELAKKIPRSATKVANHKERLTEAQKIEKGIAKCKEIIKGYWEKIRTTREESLSIFRELKLWGLPENITQIPERVNWLMQYREKMKAELKTQKDPKIQKELQAKISLCEKYSATILSNDARLTELESGLRQIERLLHELSSRRENIPKNAAKA